MLWHRCSSQACRELIDRIIRIHTLESAAELFGYSDPNYVSRLYRKLFGTSITRNGNTAPVQRTAASSEAEAEP